MTNPEQQATSRPGTFCLWAAGAVLVCLEAFGWWLALPTGPSAVLAIRYFGAALAVVAFLIAWLMWDGRR